MLAEELIGAKGPELANMTNLRNDSSIYQPTSSGYVQLWAISPAPPPIVNISVVLGSRFRIV